MHEWHLPAACATPYMCHTLYVPHPTCATPFMCHTLRTYTYVVQIQVQKSNSKSRPEYNTLDMQKHLAQKLFPPPTHSEVDQPHIYLELVHLQRRVSIIEFFMCPLGRRHSRGWGGRSKPRDIPKTERGAYNIFCNECRSKKASITKIV